MSVHAYPLNDLWEHLVEDDCECWCDPEVRWVDPETGEVYVEPMVIHNAADGRELTE